jgi:threonine dehydrogenase-like Zn-dependent dehydrogenase
MRAVTYHGTRDVRVDNVADPKIEEPTDAIIRVTSTGICGSDLHLYEVLGPSSTRATSSAMSRGASSRRSARRSRTSRPVTAS